MVSLHRRDEGDFAHASLALIGQETDLSPVLLGDETGKREDVDQLPATALQRTSESFIQQILGPHPVGVCVRADHHGGDSVGTSGRRGSARACHGGDIRTVAGANDTSAIDSYRRVMEIVTEGGI